VGEHSHLDQPHRFATLPKTKYQITKSTRGGYVPASLTDVLAILAIVISALAYRETLQTRKLQEKQFDSTRSARLRIDRFAFWPADMGTIGLIDRSDLLHMDVQNIGDAYAFDVDIRVERAGIIRAHGEVYGLPVMIRKELKVKIGKVEENTEETIVVHVTYRDHEPHVVIVTLEKGIDPYGLRSGIGLHVAKVTLEPVMHFRAHSRRAGPVST